MAWVDFVRFRVSPSRVGSLMSARSEAIEAFRSRRSLRAAYLVELEAALVRLNPKGGTPRWVVTPNPGPFFAGNTPLQLLTGSTREMAEVLRQVRRWSAARRAGNTKPH